MNFWTGLILGIIIGWLVEWIIDWLFWRRDAADAFEQGELAEERIAETESNAVTLEEEWAGRLSSAEQEYEDRLRAVEAEWQSRLNLNEQQWHSQFTTLEADNSDLRSRLADMTAGATLAAAGVRELDDEEVALPVINEAVMEDESGMTALLDEDVDFDALAPAGSWAAGQASIEVGELPRLEQIDQEPAVDVSGEMAAFARREDDLTRIKGIGPRYANILTGGGINSFDDLAATTPDRLRDVIRPSPLQQINFDSWISQAAAYAGSREAHRGDDLTELEGIGPVYAGKLREAGIASFADLAAADETTLADIIRAPAWRKINYAEWIDQARLAAAGDDVALRNLQDRLFIQTGDNLGLIRGMGGRSEAALRAAGITSFSALAAATPQELDTVIREAGVRGAFDYEAWIGEAGARAAGKRVPSRRTRATHTVSCPQDLSAVTGIGPVLEERLYAAGIGSYWDLAETPAGELSAVLGAESLLGVDLEAIKASAMQLAVESRSIGRSWDGTPPDDFEVLPGIGEIYERRLYEAGICTYESLAANSAERLAAICQAPPMHAPDYTAWIATAAELSAAKRSG
jgi:predicted flap endonuclease-1-like 5' DNA nuclease